MQYLILLISFIKIKRRVIPIDNFLYLVGSITHIHLCEEIQKSIINTGDTLWKDVKPLIRSWRKIYFVTQFTNEKVNIVALKYYEKDYSNILDQIKQTNCDVIIADRDGVGNISRAFNTAVKLNIDQIKEKEYIWFVTNIGCKPDIPEKLLTGIESVSGAAIHPKFNSDHPHISGRDKSKNPEVQEIPFIEFTAPMVRTDIFLNTWLDEDYWYYYMDLIFSKQLRDRGEKMYVHYGAPVEHVYLRKKNDPGKEEIGKLREKLRQYRDPIEIRNLRKTYGEDWRSKLFVYDLPS